MTDGSWETNVTVRNLCAHRPQLEDDTVGLGGVRGDFFRFLGGYIKHLHAPGCDFFSVIVEVLVPLPQRNVRARELLVDEVFDFNKTEAFSSSPDALPKRCL